MRKAKTTRPVEVPEPPPVKRFVAVERLQLIGVAILAAVAIAGLLGAFDDTTARSATSGTPLALHVEFPSRVQLEQHKELSIEVRNESDSSIDEVSVEIDRGYLDAFERTSFHPEPDQITPRAYVVDLGAIQPGEVRRIALEVRPEKVGRQEGELRVTSGTAALASIDLSTFVFP
jgi:hypothetical protein